LLKGYLDSAVAKLPPLCIATGTVSAAEWRILCHKILRQTGEAPLKCDKFSDNTGERRRSANFAISLRQYRPFPRS
jgi:hypothetical protein